MPDNPTIPARIAAARELAQRKARFRGAYPANYDDLGEIWTAILHLLTPPERTEQPHQTPTTGKENSMEELPTHIDEERASAALTAMENALHTLDAARFGLDVRNERSRQVAIARTHLQTAILWMKEAQTVQADIEATQ